MSGLDNARTVRSYSEVINSDHTLLLSWFIIFYVGTYRFVRLPNNGVIDKVQQKSMQSQFHYSLHDTQKLKSVYTQSYFLQQNAH